MDTKEIKPIEDFNWDALEEGENYGSVSKEDLEKIKHEIDLLIELKYGRQA